jgi:predicted transcriptional regulator
MADRNKGGRGLKAEKPYERFTVTLPPDLKERLDTLAQSRELSRSETLAAVLEEHFTGMSSLEGGLTADGGFRVQSREVSASLRWKPERRDQVAALLAQGDTLTPMVSGTVYRTETGGHLPRRTVVALAKAGILAPLTP